MSNIRFITFEQNNIYIRNGVTNMSDIDRILISNEVNNLKNDFRILVEPNKTPRMNASLYTESKIYIFFSIYKLIDNYYVCSIQIESYLIKDRMLNYYLHIDQISYLKLIIGMLNDLIEYVNAFDSRSPREKDLNYLREFMNRYINHYHNQNL